jgi:hypothetical protein
VEVGEGGAQIVIGENGRNLIEEGRPHAVEPREAAVAEAQEAHHGLHTLQGGVKLFRRFELARDEALLKRQKFEQEFDEFARIAGDVAAVFQDLPVEFSRERG